MTQMSFFAERKHEPANWEATRQAGNARLRHFLPNAGQTYARQRNFDFGRADRANVSALSPWIRHRGLVEEDVLRATLAKHRFAEAEKFIQEVFWRGYFKGWLEHRPYVWRHYKLAVRDLVNSLERDASLASRYEEAVQGKTGIACFDAWARELVETGYLHNHARMWFASIWIFTLHLPWQLGADFFYRHLLDGDPASNTCSWRWVGGLHTKGKTYLARANNIKQYTNGRFSPSGQLAVEAVPLLEPDLPAPALSLTRAPDFPGERIGLLITEEDCSPETLPLQIRPRAVLALTSPSLRSVLPMGSVAQMFGSGLVEDGAEHARLHFACDVTVSADANWQAVLQAWSRDNDLDAIVTAHLPVGPVARRLKKAASGISSPLIEVMRDYDYAVWPHAKRGFFGLKKKLPNILAELGLG